MKLVNFIVVEPNGKIVRSGICQETMLGHGASADLEFIVTDLQYDPNAFYYKDGVVTPRPSFDVVLTGLAVSQVPLGTTVECEGQSWVVDDGEIELSFTLPGTYKVGLSGFPYIPSTIEVTQL